MSEQTLRPDGQMIQVGETHISLADLRALPPDSSGWRAVACGACVRIGAGVRIGARVQIGANVWIGDGIEIAAGAQIGARAQIGDGARGIIADLGSEQIRGHARIAYWGSDGAIRISAGCHDFSLAEARTHWGAGYSGERRIGDEYLALLDYIERIAGDQT